MTKVAIIGGGCAGLGAAETLLKGAPDMQVVLIEAFDRLGGRALTNNSQGFPFDMGPQYIQDPGVNAWIGIAEKLGFDVEEFPDQTTVFRMEIGNVWQDKDVFGVPGITAANKTLDDGYEAATEEDGIGEYKTPNMPPIFEPDAMTADDYIAFGSNQYGSVVESAQPWQYIALDSDRQDIVPDSAGGIRYVTAGLGTLVAAFGQSLIDEYPDSLTVRFGKVVTRIERNAMDGDISIYSGNELVCIADYCIVSVPCSVMSRIAFIPPFDHDRIVANGYVVLGSYKKVAFTLKTMPDEIQENYQYFLYDDTLKGCWQYFRLPTAPSALIGVATGNFAAMLDTMSGADVAKAFVDMLKLAYPNDDQLIVPERPPMVTNWSETPHIRGAYSYTRYDGGAHDDPAPLDARDLIALPHADGRILFAGEATWAGAYATIHGAYYSGMRAANVILKQLGMYNDDNVDGI